LMGGALRCQTDLAGWMTVADARIWRTNSRRRRL
jgi:hypothetical protein